MAEGDHISFEASWNNLNEQVARFTRELQEKLVAYEAQGDEARAAITRAKLKGLQAPTTSPAEMSAATAAIERQNTLAEVGKRIEVEKLAVIEAQTAARVEQAALAQRLEASGEGVTRGGVVMPPARRYYSGPSGRAGGQVEDVWDWRRTQAASSGGESVALLDQQRRAALLDQQRATSQLIVSPSRRSGATSTVGQQLAEEEALRKLTAEQVRYNEQIALEATARQKAAEVLAQEQIVADRRAAGYGAGFTAASRGRLLPEDVRKNVSAPPPDAKGWGAAEVAAVRYQTRLGEYAAFSQDASLSSERLSANLTRLGMVEAESSNALRAHGALTTEFLGALARGETTVAELGYQIGATIGKFGGWALAAGATYGALGALVEFGKGAIDTSNEVAKLHRTIEDINPDHANQALQSLSRETNTTMTESGDAVFLFSRTFHNLDDATSAARLGLSALKLDNVDLATSVRMQTQIHQQYGYSLKQIGSVYDMLASGQRLYNARISDVTATLQKSTGAVKNARGDLTQLVQLSEYAVRVTQVGGAQVGTAFYRSASTQAYTPQHAATLRGLGLNLDQGWTQLIAQALQRALTLTPDQRRVMSNALFGNQYGGRVSAIFNPTNLPTWNQMAGNGPMAITPKATHGSLQEELDRQLRTAREQLHAFITELQRLGAAFAETGALTGFGLALRSIVGVMSAIRSVIDAFNELPAGMRHVVTGLVELRLAMLFFSRTGMGNSMPLLNRLRIPGLDPSRADVQMRQGLRVGTRTGLQELEKDRGRLGATMIANSEQQLVLINRRTQIEEQIARAGVGTEAQYQRANAASATILSLGREQEVMEAEYAAVMAARARLQEQMVGLSSMSRNTRYNTGQVRDLEAEVNAPLGGGPLVANTRSQTATAAAKAKAAEETTANRVATEQAGNALKREAAGSSRLLEATVTGTAMMGRARTALTGLRVGLMGIATAIDPMLIAILALPEAITLISKQYETLDKNSKDILEAADLAAKVMKPTVAPLPGGLTGLVARGASLPGVPGLWRPTGTRAPQLAIPPEIQKLLDVHYQTAQPWDVRGAGASALGYGKSHTEIIDANNLARDAQVGLADALLQARQHSYASPTQQVGFSFQELSDEAAADTKAFAQHKITKAEYNRRMVELQRSAQSSLEVLTAASTTKANAAVKAFGQGLRDQMGTAMADAARGSDFFTGLDQIGAKGLEQRVQTASARQQVYGVDPKDLRKAGETYLYMAARFRTSTDPAELQAVTTAQSRYVGGVTKNVQDLMHVAQASTTFGGARGSLSSALSLIRTARAANKSGLAEIIKKWHAYPGIIKAARAAAAEVDAMLSDNFKQVLDQLLSTMEEQSQLRASRIGGSSPEADLARSKVLLDGLRGELAVARRKGNRDTTAKLEQQVNDAQRTLTQQTADNAKNLMQAQDAIAKARITGKGPASDIARARRDVVDAQHTLDFDRAHKAGAATIATDFANLLTARNSLNDTIKQASQTIDQDAASLIQAGADLAQSQTTDPVKQAREQLAADIKILGTIHPRDYKNYSEYLAAYKEQQAKIGKDKQSLTQSNADVQMQTLQFELHTEKISNAQYIAGLQQILRMRKLSLQERQQIQQAIFDASNSSASNLNVGDITLPTRYQVKRAIADAHRGRSTVGAVSAMVTNTHHWTIVVNKNADVKKVTDAIAEAIGTNTQGIAQAMGMI